MMPIRRDVRAPLSYLLPGTDRPCSYACPPPEGVPWENAQYAAQETTIADARLAAQPPALEREGFVLCDAPAALGDVDDADAVRARLYPEVEALALALTGGRRARVFDHLVRRREADRAALSFGRRGADGRAAANGRIHNDYTEASGRRRLGLVLPPEQAARIRRYCILNVWRSIRGPVLDTPLALCDARSVSATDLVEAEVRYPQRVGEIYLATHSPRHRWHYFPAMDRHEALVFKQYDSQLSGTTRFTPHAAFDLPAVPPDAPLRESIELRCLVVLEQD
ncbi:CmcJ/NvfI family oxidoreductase [Aquabacterium sp.]|uniref:CmcJ/NvfI family oxidoreductase n=1 Tax=Aquabacterium sp. TaxID=1872578 RepID=UPI00378524A5